MSFSAATLEMPQGQKDVDPALDAVAPSGLVLRGVSSVHSLRDIPYVEDMSVQIESITEAVHRSFSISSIASSANASMSTMAQPPPTQKPLHSPGVGAGQAPSMTAGVAPATPVSNLQAVLELRSEYQRASKFIEQNGKLCMTSIILSSIIERISSSFDQAVIDYLSSASSIASVDAQYFANSYHQLRDFYRHLCRIGPLAAILPNASRLSTLVKWDYRQMINSFLTLIRTSPGFIAASYRELEPAQAAAFLGGQDTDIVGRVKLAQRRDPLGILYHGVFHNSPYRANFFAAVCASVLLENEDDNLCLAIFNRFNSRPLPRETAKQLTNFLRTYICNGLFLAAPTQSTPTCEVGEDDYVNTAVSRLIALLVKPDGVLSRQFTELMVALDQQVANELVEQLAIKYFVCFVRSLICDPHSSGLLTDMYISENTRRYILSPLVDRISCIIEDPYGHDLLDALIGRSLPEPTDINVFFAPGEHIVLNMTDIVTLFNALLPVNVGAAAAVPSNGDDDADDDDENEWCFSNIRSDLEPVIKELTGSLPHLSNRLNRNSVTEPGIFAEHWQVFKIEADGLINDISETLWPTEAPLDVVVLALTGDSSKSVYEMLADAIREAEDSGNFLDQMLLGAALKKPAPQLLGEIAHKLECNLEFLTQNVEKLETLLEKSLERLSVQQELLHGCMQRLSNQRAIVWYESEVRTCANWQRASDVIGILRGEKALQRSNSGSSTTSTVSSVTRRSSRARRLSILSTHSLSVGDSFFVSKDYLPRPKLSDREVELTIQYMRTHHIQNFCPSEELIHRFTCEISSLVERIFDRDFLLNTASYKLDLRREPSFGRDPPGNPVQTHRMSMSVLPDMRGSVSGQRYANSSHQFRRSSPNLLDFFEWRSSGGGDANTAKPQSCELQLGLDVAGGDEYNGLPDRSMIVGLLLSDLGLEFLERGSDVDIYMQQTGRMVLDGDSGIYQPILDNISVQTNPMAKLRGLHTLVEVARYQPSLRGGGDIVNRDDMVQELSQSLCREPGTLFRDLQLIAAFVPINVLDSTAEGQAFWDVAEVASSIVELAMSKSMGLAQRILKYHMETAFASSVTTSGISDVVAIWSFCARYGRAAAQRRLAQLYMDFPHTQLDVMPFSRPGVIFEGVEPSGVREAVAAHWMQHAADRGDAEAQQWCQQRLY